MQHAAQLRITVEVCDRATAQLLRLSWMLWWMAWGTNGIRRKRALVAIEDVRGSELGKMWEHPE